MPITAPASAALPRLSSVAPSAALTAVARIAALAFAAVAPAHGAVTRFDCTLEPSMAQPVVASAQAWRGRSELTRRAFALDLARPEPLELAEGPTPLAFWGAARVTRAEGQLTLTWRPAFDPGGYRAGSRPEVRLFVDLDNGQAFEAYAVDDGPRIGKKYGELVRSGVCEIFLVRPEGRAENGAGLQPNARPTAKPTARSSTESPAKPSRTPP